MGYLDMFEDTYVDFLATTGINTDGALNRIRSQYDGEHKSFATMIDSTTGGYTLRENYFQFQKHSGIGGLGGFTDEFSRGIGARMSLDTSQRFLLNRMQQDQSTYDKYMQDTLVSKAEYDQLTGAMDEQDIAFLEQQNNLDVMRNNAQASRTTSSVGEYSQAARRQMQGTLRYINTMRSFKAPDQMELDPTFVDPISGQKRHIDEEFDPSSMSGGFETKEDVEAFVRGKFNERNQALKDDLWQRTLEYRGLDHLAQDGQLSDDLRNIYESLSADLEAASGDRTIDQYVGNIKGHVMIGEGENRMTAANYRDLRSAFETDYDQVVRFAEARTISELMGNTKGYWSETYQGETTGITGTQGIQRAFATGDYSVEQFISDTSEDTFNRFSVQNMNNMDAVREEYERRRSLAKSQVANIDLRNRLSKEREETLAVQRRKAQRTLEQQQQDYQSTLSGLGANDPEFSGEILFTATRPQ